MGDFFQRLYQPSYMVKKDLVQGDLPSTKEGYSTAFATAWAAILETFLIALIGMADTIMVSGLGESAIAAVGLATQPRYLAQTAILALNYAVTSICARRRGEQDQEGAISTLKQGLILCAILSGLLMLIFLPAADWLIRFMGSDTSTHQMSFDYFYIILLGLPLSNLSLTISSAQRGIGETKASMKINMTANIVNIIFNYLLINGIGIFPRLGVKGAAIATVIGYGAGLLVAVASVSKRENFLFILEKENWSFRRSSLRGIFQVSSGSFVEQISLRFGFMMYAKVIAGLGMLMIAAHQILMNIMSLSFSFGEGFGIAASSLVGQNLGAKRPDLSIVYGKICQRMTLISSSILFVVFGLFGEQMVSIFSTDPEILEVSRIILVIIGFIIFGQASQMVFMGALRGAGDTKYTAAVSMLSIMILRPVAGYLFAYPLGLGLVGAWFSMVLDQFVRLILTYVRFSSGKWTKIKL